MEGEGRERWRRREREIENQIIFASIITQGPKDNTVTCTPANFLHPTALAHPVELLLMTARAPQSQTVASADARAQPCHGFPLRPGIRDIGCEQI